MSSIQHPVFSIITLTAGKQWFMQVQSDSAGDLV